MDHFGVWAFMVFLLSKLQYGFYYRYEYLKNAYNYCSKLPYCFRKLQCYSIRPNKTIMIISIYFVCKCDCRSFILILITNFISCVILIKKVSNLLMEGYIYYNLSPRFGNYLRSFCVELLILIQINISIIFLRL